MPVSSLDLLPTALAAAGIDVPDDVTLDGIDLLPVPAMRPAPMWSLQCHCRGQQLCAGQCHISRFCPL